MEEELKKKIDELDTKRAELLQTICEDTSLWHPNIIIQLVYEIRSITKLLKMLKGETDRFEY